MHKILEYFRTEEKFQVDDYIETVISESAIAKAEKNNKRKIKLDSTIEIQVNVRDIEEIDKLIEVGFDEETNRKFYKIYFQEEV